MRNLLLSSFIAIFLTSCTLGHYGRLKKTDNDLPSSPASIFGDNFNSFLFKTNITVYGKDFSGLLVTKQMSPEDYRVIFTTELGMKLFDFEFKDTSFTLHYCVPQFNKPKLLKTIQEDIRILLMNDLKGKSFQKLADPKGSYTIYRKEEGSFSDYYFIETATKQLVKIEHSKKQLKKVIFALSNYQNNFPNNVMIKHYNIKLKIELNLLKK
ncbi:MAG: hypothetical protein K0Q95_525 [Bacteroidota bacterium]|jgi:hypothetical protein|nr:hypothetical protein [Bacteroidota bacterium]